MITPCKKPIGSRRTRRFQHFVAGLEGCGAGRTWDFDGNRSGSLGRAIRRCGSRQRGISAGGRQVPERARAAASRNGKKIA